MNFGIHGSLPSGSIPGLQNKQLNNLGYCSFCLFLIGSLQMGLRSNCNLGYMQSKSGTSYPIVSIGGNGLYKVGWTAVQCSWLDLIPLRKMYSCVDLH